MRVNLGCGAYPLEGFVNVDVVPPADLVLDFMAYEWPSASLDEVRAIHVVEHLARDDAALLLSKARRWVKPGGSLIVEVPDLEVIMTEGTSNPDWERCLYGSQEHEGAFHRTGFVEATLRQALRDAGWTYVQTRRFRSDLPMRPGMACLEAIAR